jgi:hypothetical protein
MSEYNGQNIPHGARVLSISNVNYAAEDFSINLPMSEIQRRNVVTGAPSGFVLIDDFVDGSATLQLGNAQIAPVRGATFATVGPDGANNINCVVSQVGIPEAVGTDKKVTINWKQTYN